jgi:hypothetical protein
MPEPFEYTLAMYLTLKDLKMLRWTIQRVKDETYIKSEDNNSFNLLYKIIDQSTQVLIQRVKELL